MKRLSDLCQPAIIKFPHLSSFQTSDWLISINKSDQNLTFKLIDSDLKPVTVPLTGKYEFNICTRHSIFYNNGTLIEDDVVYFQNYQTICSVYKYKETKKFFALHQKSTCCCGKTLDIKNPDNLFFCSHPDCHMCKCLECAQSSDGYKSLCFTHHVEKSNACQDFTFRITKIGEKVTVDIGYEKLSFKVEEIVGSSSERLVILNQANNFYYDCGIMNLHQKDGQKVPFAFILFDKDERQNKFGIQTYSSTHDKSVQKIIARWNKYWKQILQNKKQNYSFLSFVNRKSDLQKLSLPDNIDTIKSKLNAYKENSSVPDHQFQVQDKMPLFNSLPILKFGGWTIFNCNSTALKNPTIKEATIRAQKGNTTVCCNLWSGAARTDYFSCFTNSNGERELWINNILVMKNMRLIGYQYD